MFGLTDRELNRAAEQLNLASYRKDQIKQWIYEKHVGDFSLMTNLPASLRQQLQRDYQITQSRVVENQQTTGAIKLLVEFSDERMVETVIIGYRSWSTVCISTQFGCDMGCVFCASGTGVPAENLSAHQMAEQIWHARIAANQQGFNPVRNVVLMGVGEPLANLDNLLEFIAAVNDPSRFAVGQRRITVSTVGLVPQIKKLADSGRAVYLAVSLHAPNDELRRRLMPTAGRYPLQDLLSACRNYTEDTGRRVTYGYILLRGVNDTDKHGTELADLLKGHNCLVNLIPFNPIPGLAFAPSLRGDEFRRVLEQRGINVTRRRSLGSGVSAACGQLRNRRK